MKKFIFATVLMMMLASLAFGQQKYWEATGYAGMTTQMPGFGNNSSPGYMGSRLQYEGQVEGKKVVFVLHEMNPKKKEKYSKKLLQSYEEKLALVNETFKKSVEKVWDYTEEYEFMYSSEVEKLSEAEVDDRVFVHLILVLPTNKKPADPFFIGGIGLRSSAKKPKFSFHTPNFYAFFFPFPMDYQFCYALKLFQTKLDSVRKGKSNSIVKYHKMIKKRWTQIPKKELCLVAEEFGDEARLKAFMKKINYKYAWKIVSREEAMKILVDKKAGIALAHKGNISPGVMYIINPENGELLFVSDNPEKSLKKIKEFLHQPYSSQNVEDRIHCKKEYKNLENGNTRSKSRPISNRGN